MKLTGLLTLTLLLGFIGLVCTSHFRGGYITWAPDTTVASQIVVTWRLSWMGSTANCDQNSRDLIGDIKNIVCACDQQCIPSTANAQVVCTDTNAQEDWSSGVNTAKFNLSSSSAQIRYTGGNWITLLNGGNAWQLVAHVDLNKRPDNNQINTSPKTIQSPIVYTQQGCPMIINIPVVDVDDDVVRCRWADGESGGLTRPSADVLTTLDEANCRVTVVHNTDASIAIALAIEDFIPPYTTSSRPLSTVPLQFLVKVDHVDPPLPCDMYGHRPVFVQPTPEDNAVYNVVSGTAINITIRARAIIDPTLPITEFSTISPQGLTKSNLMDGGSDEKLINIRYSPTAYQNDTELFCFAASDGRQSSEHRCVRFNIIAVPPVISRAPISLNISTDTNSSTADAFWTPPLASDNTGETVALTSNYNPGDAFLIGTTTVTYKAIDVNGNTATYSFDVVVTDKEPPKISDAPTNLNVSTGHNLNIASVVWTPPMASDNSGKAVTLTSDYSPGENFTIGNTTVTYTAVDAYGNTDKFSFEVVVTDNEPPNISGAPTSLIVSTNTNSATATVIWTPLMSSDNSGEPVTLTSDYSPGDNYTIGNTTVTYTAVDAYGNVAKFSFDFVVTDDEPPNISGAPTSLIVSTNTNSATASVIWTPPMTSDNSGEPVTLTSDYSPGDNFTVGNTTVTYTALDAYGNTAKFSFEVVVTDDEPPNISGAPTSLIVSTNTNSATATVIWTPPMASDNSGELVTLTSDYSPGYNFPIGNTTVTYTAVDVYGNVAKFSFEVVVTDVEPPVMIGLPASQNVSTDSNSATAAVFWTPPTARDNSGEAMTLTSDYRPGDNFAIGNTTVTYIAEDAYGNVATHSFDIIVTDNEEPRVIYGCPVFNEIFTATLNKTVKWTSPNFTDNSGKLELTSNLKSPSTLEVGSHNVVYVARDPSTNTLSCNVTINVTAACYQSSTTLISRNFSWPFSGASSRGIESLEVCANQTKNSGRGIAVRVCEFDEANGGSGWLAAKYVGCGEQEDYQLSLQDLSQTAVSEDNVLIVAQAVVNATVGLLQNKTNDDIEEVANTLSNIVEAGSDDPQVTVSVVNIVNNVVMAADSDESSGDEDIPNKDNSDNLLNILRDFEEQIERAASSGQSIPPVVENNIIFTTTSVPPETTSDISFAITTSKSDDSGFGDVDVGSEKEAQPAESAVRTSISLPAAIFQESNTSLGVSFVVHRTDTLFPSNSTNATRIVGSNIISAIITGAKGLDNLSDPVVLQFSALGRNPSCVFWDFDIQDWSQKGCELKKHVTSRVTCHCYHLTNFAVLLDVKQESGHIILDVISKIGCVMSMIALLLTIGIFTGFRRLRRGRGPKATARKILIQFSLALCLLYFVFLVGIDQTQSRGGCIFVAMLLQYLTLVSLMWMGVEAQNMYACVVRVFDPKSDHFFLRAAVAAWGAPLVITAISVGAGFTSYDHGNYCFVASNPLYFGVILPVAIILLHNLVIFGMVIRVLWKAKTGGNRKQRNTLSTSERLKNALTVSILMGLTWLFGFFAIEDAEFAFSLIFCLCNSFQGIIIFILFCARQGDVQNILRPYYMRIWCVRVCVAQMKRGDSSGYSLATKSPYSEDQFTFEPANSAFDFESTTQANMGTVISEMGPEATIFETNIDMKLGIAPAARSLADVADEKLEVNDDSKLSEDDAEDKLAAGRSLKLNKDDADNKAKVDVNSKLIEDDVEDKAEAHVEDKSEVDEAITLNKVGAVDDSEVNEDSKLRKDDAEEKPRADEESDLDKDDAQDKSEVDEDSNWNKDYVLDKSETDEESKLDKADVVDNSKVDADSKSNDATTSSQKELKTSNNSEEIAAGRLDAPQRPVIYKRRIFSTYEIFVNVVCGEKDASNCQQMASGGDRKESDDLLKWDNQEDKCGRKDALSDKESKDESVSEDEDMFVAPIEIENAIKDARVDSDRD